MMHEPKEMEHLRTRLVFAVALLLSTAPVSGVAAGMHGQASLVLSRPSIVNVLRPGTLETPADRSPQGSPAGSDSSPSNAVSGTITLQAQGLSGSQALDVRGQAPANAPVTITLFAIVSSDVPTIVVSRHDVVTDVNGRFGAVIPIAPAFERGTILKVVATSASGAGPASAQVIMDVPNAGVSVPLEQTPHRAR